MAVNLLAQIQGSNVMFFPLLLASLLLCDSLLELAVESFWKLFSVHSRHRFEYFKCIFQFAFGQKPSWRFGHYQDVEEVEQERHGRDQAEYEPIMYEGSYHSQSH